MTAQIISFPRKIPLEDHELPEYWGQYERGHYIHVTYDGYKSHEDAFAFCDAHAKVKRRPGESDSAFQLRQGMIGLRFLKPLDG